MSTAFTSKGTSGPEELAERNRDEKTFCSGVGSSSCSCGAAQARGKQARTKGRFLDCRQYFMLGESGELRQEGRVLCTGSESVHEAIELPD